MKTRWRMLTQASLVKGVELQSKEATQEMLLNQLLIAKITVENLRHDLSLPTLLLEEHSLRLSSIGLQPCWSTDWPRTLWKAQRPCRLHAPAHTPTLTLHLVTGWRQGSRDSGTVGQTEAEGGGGLGGLVADTLSCPELLRQTAGSIVQQHPLFFIHHPLCPPPMPLKDRLCVEVLMFTRSQAKWNAWKYSFNLEIN